MISALHGSCKFLHGTDLDFQFFTNTFSIQGPEHMKASLLFPWTSGGVFFLFTLVIKSD